MVTFPRIDELTAKVKLYAPKPDSFDKDTYDSFIDDTIDKLLNDVADFINRPVDQVPEQLDSSLAIKAAGWLIDVGAFMPISDRQAGTESQIVEGDTTVSYATPLWFMTRLSEVNFLDKDFKQRLVHYRRLLL